MKLSKSFTKVTPFSKYLAMILFILFPFVGFYLGVQYEKIIVPKPSFPQNSWINIPLIAAPTSWKTYTSNSAEQKIGFNFQISYPSTWFATDNNPTHSSGAPTVVLSEKPIATVSDSATSCVEIRTGIWPVLNTAIEDYSQGTKFSSVSFDLGNLQGIKQIFLSQNFNKEGQPPYRIILDGGINKTYGDEVGIYEINPCKETNPKIFNQIISSLYVHSNN